MHQIEGMSQSVDTVGFTPHRLRHRLFMVNGVFLILGSRILLTPFLSLGKDSHVKETP